MSYANNGLIFIIVIIAVTIAILCIFSILIVNNYVKIKANENIVKLNAMFQAEESERKRISSEIHDNIGLKLSVVKIQFELIRQKYRELHNNPIPNLIDETIRDIRYLSRTQSSYYVIQNGLLNELDLMKDYLLTLGTFEVIFEVCEFGQPLKNEFLIHLFRIIQEMINNTLKHAHANKLILLITETETNLTLRYSDNGVGISHSIIGGSGLRNIATRISLFNGELKQSNSTILNYNYEIVFQKQFILK